MGCSFLYRVRRRSNRLRPAAMTLGLLTCFELSAAGAQALPPFPELLRESERLSPRLLEGEANVQAAEGLARQSAALPNPIVSYESENFGGSNNFARISPIQNTVSLSETIEIGGKRGARIAAGAANAEAAKAGSTTDQQVTSHEALLPGY